MTPQMLFSKRPKSHSPPATRRRTHQRPARASNARLVVIPLLLAAIIAMPRAAPQSSAPTVHVWYRGVPAGVPRQDDLAVIRAHGFGGVVWPDVYADAMRDIARMASIVDLGVMMRGAPNPVSAETATATG